GHHRSLSRGPAPTRRALPRNLPLHGQPVRRGRWRYRARRDLRRRLPHGGPGERAGGPRDGGALRGRGEARGLGLEDLRPPRDPAVEARPPARGIGPGARLSSAALLWLPPTLAAMLMWGIAQGLVKKYIGEVPPARFCMYYGFANAAVSLAFWASQDAPSPFAAESRGFATFGLLAYTLDGIAWIFYYQSIVHGPISIVGTLSAAYPALTVIFARIFLGER